MRDEKSDLRALRKILSIRFFLFFHSKFSARIKNFIPVDMTLDRVMTFGRRIRGMKRKEKKNLNHSTRNVGIRLASNIPDDSAG